MPYIADASTALLVFRCLPRCPAVVSLDACDTDKRYGERVNGRRRKMRRLLLMCSVSLHISVVSASCVCSSRATFVTQRTDRNNNLNIYGARYFLLIAIIIVRGKSARVDRYAVDGETGDSWWRKSLLVLRRRSFDTWTLPASRISVLFHWSYEKLARQNMLQLSHFTSKT